MPDELVNETEGSQIDSPAMAQALCTALQIALVDLLASWQVYPSAVTGHSSGEIAAAFCAGALCRESALKVAYYRGFLAARLIHNEQRPRGMMSVGLSEKEVRPYLARVVAQMGKDGISIGCVNSPRNLTLSGDDDCLNTLKCTLEEEQIFARKLAVKVAYHSKDMETIASDYLRCIRNLSPGTLVSGEGRSPPLVYSSVTGDLILVSELSKGEYWVNNMVSIVRFSDAISNMCARVYQNQTSQDINHIIEIGPHSALKRPIQEINPNVAYDSVLQRGANDLENAIYFAGRLKCKGYKVKILAINSPGKSLSSLHVLNNTPEYPFNHSQRYWVESRLSKEIRFRKHPRHELLGTRSIDWNPLEAKWRNIIRKSDVPWVDDHKSNGATLYPASGMVVMAIEAMRQMSDPKRQVGGFRLKDVTFSRALLIPEGQEGIETEIYLRARNRVSQATSYWREFRICAYLNDEWADCSQGFITSEYEEAASKIDNGKEAEEIALRYQRLHAQGLSACQIPCESIKRLYEVAKVAGYDFGPTFQTLNEVFYNQNGEAVASLCVHDWVGKVPVHARLVQDYVIHPTALDGVFQTTVVAMSAGGTQPIATMIPTQISDFWISTTLLTDHNNDRVQVYTRNQSQGLNQADFELLALNRETQEPQIVIDGYRVTAVSNLTMDQPSWRRLCYYIDWKPDVRILSDSQLATLCISSTHWVGSVTDEKLRNWELVCWYFISVALNTEILRAFETSKPHLQKYIKWMHYHYDRYSAKFSNTYPNQWDQIMHDHSYRNGFIDEVESSGPEGLVFVTVGRSLLSILSDEVDPLEVLFGNNLLSDFYVGPGLEVSYTKLIAYVDMLAHNNGNMSIIEIGAGTGGATSRILDILSPRGGPRDRHGTFRYSSYTYTDISPAFFKEAEKRFSDHSDRISFKTLDIERDPEEQGFQAGQYDLVIGSAVLHATAHLESTIRNARKLLKPGGRIALIEPCNLAAVRIPFVFGLLSGWWLSTESNRSWGPLVSDNEWQTHLENNGFHSAEMSLRDSSDATLFALSLIGAIADGKDAKSYATFEVIILSEDLQIQEVLAYKIKTQLELKKGCICEIASLQEASLQKLEHVTVVSLLEIKKPLLFQVAEPHFSWLKHIFASVSRIIWVTSYTECSKVLPTHGLASGLGRSIASEYSRLCFVLLTLQDSSSLSSMASNIARVSQEHIDSGLEPSQEVEYMEINGLLYTNRIAEANRLNVALAAQLSQPKPEMRAYNEMSGRNLSLTIAIPGLLETLRFEDDSEAHRELADDEVEVIAKANGVNFKDVMVAMGQLPDKVLGQECSGIVRRAGSKTKFRPGERVCCLASNGAYKTHVRCHSSAVSRLPDDMSFCEAAGLPVVFCTAYYSLFHVGRLKKGESILIHAAAGGVGQAAIQLAKMVDADIYVTVSTEEKKKLLMEAYGIPQDHFFFSRNMTFEQGIKRMTNGHGVDVVLNSLAGESLRRSWSCVAPLGRFIEIGKQDIELHGELPMLPFSKNITFASVDLGVVATMAKPLMREIMDSAMALLFEKGSNIKVPQPLHVFKGSQVEEAFRYLQSGKNTGKSVVQLQDDDVVPVWNTLTVEF